MSESDKQSKTYSLRTHDKSCNVSFNSAVDTVVSPSFLSALEDGGSVTAQNGWQPHHLELYDDSNTQSPIGFMPLYAKSHSWGEYIFDWSWAESAKNFGVNYYPKLISMSPFTPITSQKLWGSIDAKRALVTGLNQILTNSNISSAHALFITKEESTLFEEAGFFIRTTNQFHWNDQDFGNFDGFLASFNHKHRKNVRQERKKVTEAGVEFTWKEGSDILESDWDFFYQCYLSTTSYYGAIPYIERKSYSLLSEHLGNDVLLLIAKKDNRPVASAFYIRTQNGLCGRYWGAIEYIANLHFEACYYQPIEYCLNTGIDHFEAGAQGEHKIWRGLTPATIYSAHKAKDPTFHRAIASHSQLENDYHRKYSESAMQHSPYKNAAGVEI